MTTLNDKLNSSFIPFRQIHTMYDKYNAKNIFKKMVKK